MNERTRNIPVRVWMILGIFVGIMGAVALGGAAMTTDSDDNTMSRIQDRNAQTAQVLEMLRR